MSRGGEMVLGIVFCPEGYNCIGYPKTGKKKSVIPISSCLGNK